MNHKHIILILCGNVSSHAVMTKPPVLLGRTQGPLRTTHSNQPTLEGAMAAIWSPTVTLELQMRVAKPFLPPDGDLPFVGP